MKPLNEVLFKDRSRLCQRGCPCHECLELARSIRRNQSIRGFGKFAGSLELEVQSLLAQAPRRGCHREMTITRDCHEWPRDARQRELCSAEAAQEAFEGFHAWPPRGTRDHVVSRTKLRCS